MKIIISGTVGVGKTTISKNLYNYLKNININSKLFEEISEDDPLIFKYYENRTEWSFITQINFVLDRFKKSFYSDKDDSKVKIFDRHFLDDFIFANMKSILNDMSHLNWQTYSLLNNELTNKLNKNGKIDYLFLLKADFDKIIQRIINRNRESEKNVNIEYWKDLYYQYYENKKILKYLNDNVKNLIIIDANTNDTKKIVENIIYHIIDKLK